MTAARKRRAVTTIEVLASTLLATLLMTALLTVMRGLKAQERTLDARLPTVAWRESLSAVLQRDLERSLTYVATPQRLTLTGYAAIDDQTGRPNWLPGIVHYEIQSAGEQSWLVRRAASSGDAPSTAAANLALRGAGEIRIGVGQAAAPSFPRESPVVDGLVIEFWNDQEPEPLFRHAHRRP